MNSNTKVKLHNFFTIDIQDVKTKKIDTVKAENRVITSNILRALAKSGTGKLITSFILYNTVDDGTSESKSASATLSTVTQSDIKQVDENTVRVDYSYTLPTTANNGLTIAAIGLGNGSYTNYSITRANLQDSSGGPIQIVKDETMIITITATVFLTIELPSNVYRYSLLRDPLINIIFGTGLGYMSAFASCRRLTGQYSSLMPLTGSFFGKSPSVADNKINMSLTLAAEYSGNNSDIQSLCVCTSYNSSSSSGVGLTDSAAQNPGNYVISLNDLDCITDTDVPLPLIDTNKYKLPAYYIKDDKLVVKKNGVVLNTDEYTINKEWIEPILIESVRDKGAPFGLNDNCFHVEHSEMSPHWFAIPVTDTLSVAFSFYVHSSTYPSVANGLMDYFNTSTLTSQSVKAAYLTEGKTLVSSSRPVDETNYGSMPITLIRGTGESNSNKYYCYAAMYGYLYVLTIDATSKKVSWTYISNPARRSTFATHLVSATCKYYLRGYDSMSYTSAFYKLTGDPLNTGDFSSMSSYSRTNIDKMKNVIRFHPSNDELIYNATSYEYFMYKVDDDAWYDRSYVDINIKLELGGKFPQIVTYSDSTLAEEISREDIKVYLDFDPLEDVDKAQICFCMPCDSTHMRFRYQELYQGKWRTVNRKLVKIGNEWIPERPIGFTGIQAGVRNDADNSYWLYDTFGRSDAYSGKVNETPVASSITIPGSLETDVITVDYTLDYIPKDINRKVTLTQSIEFISAE